MFWRFQTLIKRDGIGVVVSLVERLTVKHGRRRSIVMHRTKPKYSPSTANVEKVDFGALASGTVGAKVETSTLNSFTPVTSVTPVTLPLAAVCAASVGNGLAISREILQLSSWRNKMVSIVWVTRGLGQNMQIIYCFMSYFSIYHIQNI